MPKAFACTALVVLLAAAPFGLSTFTLAVLTLGLTYGLFTYGLDLAWGRARMVSVGHAAFFGLGAYAVALGRNHGWPLVVTLTLAFVAAVVIAVLVARIGLAAAVPDAPLILLTMGVGLLLQKAAASFTPVTGGSNGLSVSDTGVVTGYYRTLVVVAAVVALCVWLTRSRFGAQLAAAARNPERAEQTGIDTVRVRTTAFAVSATVSAIAGALYAPVAGLVSPPVFGLALSTSVLVWLAVGGRESVAGPFLGAVVLTAGQQLLGSSWQSWYVLGLAAVFILVVQVLPGGVAGTVRGWLRRGRAAVALPRVRPRPRAVPATDDPALVLQGISKSFGPVRVLDGVDLTVAQGRCVCLIGPNGAGKSTLLAIAAGQLAADAGSLRLFGRDASALPVHTRARLGVGRMFQIPSVIAELSPADNIRLARLGAPAEIRLPAEYLDLAADENTVAGTLALADRRRLELAMVLSGAPRLVLLDEPAAGLGPDDARRLVRALRDVIAHTGCAMLVVEHDMEIVRGLADEVVALDQGRVIAHGSMDEIVADAAVRQAYLGAGSC